MPVEILPPFPGFREQAFTFLAGLAENNSRDWFKPRKSTFDDEIIWPLRCLVADLSRRLDGTGLPLSGDPSKSLFRIYRDVRFSKNKEPYKRHAAAVLSRSGSRKDIGGIYVHVEPNSSFVAAGFWQPTKEVLQAWRERLVSDPETFLGILHDLKRRDFELVQYSVLKRSPRGFQDVADEEVAEVLKHKSYMVQRSFTNAELQSPDFADQVVEFAQTAGPLLQHGWHIMDALEQRA